MIGYTARNTLDFGRQGLVIDESVAFEKSNALWSGFGPELPGFY